MTRRHPKLRDQLLHQWRQMRRNELSRTLRHMKVQEQRREKRATFVRNYVMNSFSSIDRTESKRHVEGQEFVPTQN